VRFAACFVLCVVYTASLCITKLFTSAQVQLMNMMSHHELDNLLTRCCRLAHCCYCLLAYEATAIQLRAVLYSISAMSDRPLLRVLCSLLSVNSIVLVEFLESAAKQLMCCSSCCLYFYSSKNSIAAHKRDSPPTPLLLLLLLGAATTLLLLLLLLLLLGAHSSA
jgi:hypothetical protein